MSQTQNAFEQSVYGEKYDVEHAKHYYNKHRYNLWRRVGNWCENRMLRKSLRQAGNPLVILDIPCGTGRFWSTMQHRHEVRLIAADYNPAMIHMAYETKQNLDKPHLTPVIASAFKIPFPDNSVENICCQRLIHHMGKIKERQELLAELHRVTSNTVCLSLQVEGNWYAMSRLPKQKRTPHIEHRKYIFYQTQIEQELRDAGFIILGYADKFKGISAWRSYTLKKIPKANHPAWHCPQCFGALTPQSDRSYRCEADKLVFKPNAYGVLDLSLRHASDD